MALRTVIIVEDQDDIRETMKEVLELEGFHVNTAANGQIALDILKQTPQPCLILLDIMMPIMNGWEFLEFFKTIRTAKCPNCPVVVMSAFADQAARAKEEGVDFLRKPLDIEKIVDVVTKHCRVA